MITRQHILDEMKRTALENNGVPLGYNRFREVTGIKPYDWQRYWPRYSDLIREAGFAPNEMQGARTNEDMIEQFVVLARELGRIPTMVDLRIKRHNDSNFPSENTFRRFGTKNQFIAKIVEHCRNRSNYDDVLGLFDAALKDNDSKHQDDDASEVEQFGFVYLLKSGRYYKIGKTNAVGRRERELAIQMPEKAATVHSIKTDDPAGIEAYWHKRFESKRKGGEWFDLSAEDVRAFKRRKFM